jgi:hypothetical protein
MQATPLFNKGHGQNQEFRGAINTLWILIPPKSSHCKGRKFMASRGIGQAFSLERGDGLFTRRFAFATGSGIDEESLAASRRAQNPRPE